MNSTDIVVLVLAVIGIVAGGFGAISGDVRYAGGGVVLVGLAVLFLVLT